MNPEVLKTTPPPPPIKKPCTLSYSCEVTIDRKQAKKFDRDLPLTRPRGVSPKKKVAWRLVKKWFNRYEKPLLIGHTVIMRSQDGQTQAKGTIANARIYKSGARGRIYDITVKPVTNEQK